MVEINQIDDTNRAQEAAAPLQGGRKGWLSSEFMVLLVGRIALVVFLLCVWQYLDVRVLPDFVISSPTQVAARLVSDLGEPKVWHDTWITVQEWIFGYFTGAVVGIVLGLILGLNRLVRGIFEPVLSTINAIPKVALAPLFLVAMGLGPGSKIAIAAMMVALLMFYNTMGGVAMTPKPLVDVLRVMGANRWTILRRVMLPFLSTYIIAGLKSSVPLAIVGVIVGEFIGADAGIGHYIRDSTNLFDSAGLFSGIVILIVLTLIGNGMVQLLENRILRWRR